MIVLSLTCFVLSYYLNFLRTSCLPYDPKRTDTELDRNTRTFLMIREKLSESKFYPSKLPLTSLFNNIFIKMGRSDFMK